MWFLISLSFPCIVLHIYLYILSFFLLNHSKSNLQCVSTRSSPTKKRKKKKWRGGKDENIFIYINQKQFGSAARLTQQIPCRLNLSGQLASFGFTNLLTRTPTFTTMLTRTPSLACTGAGREFFFWQEDEKISSFPFSVPLSLEFHDSCRTNSDD